MGSKRSQRPLQGPLAMEHEDIHVDLFSRETESSQRRKDITKKQLSSSMRELESSQETHHGGTSAYNSPLRSPDKYKRRSPRQTPQGLGDGSPKEVREERRLSPPLAERQSAKGSIKERIHFDARASRDRRRRARKQQQQQHEEVNNEVLDKVLKQMGYSATQDQLDALCKGIKHKLDDEVKKEDEENETEPEIQENANRDSQMHNSGDAKAVEDMASKKSERKSRSHAGKNFNTSEPYKEQYQSNLSSKQVVQALMRQLPTPFRQALNLESRLSDTSASAVTWRYRPKGAIGVPVRPLNTNSKETGPRNQGHEDILKEKNNLNGSPDSTTRKGEAARTHSRANKNQSTEAIKERQIEQYEHNSQRPTSKGNNDQGFGRPAAMIHPRELGSIQKFLTRQEEARKTKEEQELPFWTTGENWTPTVTKPQPFQLHAGEWNRCHHNFAQNEDVDEVYQSKQNERKYIVPPRKRKPVVNWQRVFDITGKGDRSSCSSAPSSTFPSFVQLNHYQQMNDTTEGTGTVLSDEFSSVGESERSSRNNAPFAQHTNGHDNSEPEEADGAPRQQHEQLNPIDALKFHYRDQMDAGDEEDEEFYSSAIISRSQHNKKSYSEDVEDGSSQSMEGRSNSLLDEVIASLSSNSNQQSSNRVTSNESTPLPSIAETLSEHDDATTNSEYRPCSSRSRSAKGETESPSGFPDNFSNDNSGISEHILDVSSIKAYGVGEEQREYVAPDRTDVVSEEGQEEERNWAYVGSNSSENNNLLTSIDDVVHTMNVRKGLKVAKGAYEQ
eukprot:gb/GECG01006367.1/.p1 GENE.gb/GECG01006367.1/~~gb/GECG01006367.1/.p1  ORF type:complete len:786 (+),score=138.73 gb/GECG01006367.1/:1-2358(+)